MQIVDLQAIAGKKVLLRLDIDVSIENGQIAEDFRLRAGLPTLKLCLENASEVIIMGHIGRPGGKIVEELSVAPIKEWFISQGLRSHLTSGKLKALENLRFDPRESFDYFDCAQYKSAQDYKNIEFARELGGMGEVYVNEAFASYNPAVSTTILPKLLPHYAGLRFAEEVKVLTKVRENPKKPLVVVMGGAKVKDKLPVIEVLAKKADAVLVGGKLVAEIKEQNLSLPANVMVGMLSEDGFDIAPQTTQSWVKLFANAAEIVWNGPVGKTDNGQLRIDNLGSARGTYEIAKMILSSQAEIVVGGGDTVAFLSKAGLLQEFEKRGFVSTGGGAMLKLLSEGTLPTIAVLE